VAETAAVVIPAMLLALPWYIRNVAVYGWPDFFGLIRHDQIVVGQLRTVEYLAQYGWNSYLQRLVEFTFKSFWGVFGWLGVFMDSRVYMALAVLSGVVAGGLGLWMADGGWRMANGEWRASSHHAARTTQHAPRSTHYAARLLAISALLTFLSYAWYNIQFVQHQGRYLFTALIPIGLAFAIGWEAAVRPPNGRLLAAGLVLAGAGLVAWERLAGHGLPKWPLAIIALVAAGLVLADFGQRIPWAQAARSVGPGSAPRVTHHATRNTQHVIRAILFALPFALLPLLSFYALFKAIVPQLR
jgi:hypothetical protein